MAIKVLLRRNIEGVGDVGEVVRVRPGYARNFLLPKGYAALVTADAMARIEKDKAAEAVRQAALAQERAQVADRLRDLSLKVEARAGADGHLYGSVGPRQVIAALLAQGLRFEERHVRFETVRELGDYEVDVVLARDHVVPVKLSVVQDAHEAQVLAEEAEAEAAAAARREAEAPPAEDAAS
jgi:large subunit ribosomal protein L9